METPQLLRRLKEWHNICSRFANGYPYYIRMDCINQLNSLIWEAYCKRPQDVENLDGYIVKTVFYTLRAFVERNSGIYVPRYSNLKDSFHRIDYHDFLSPNGIDTSNELLEQCCRDNTDRDILVLRYQGYTISEVVEKLGISRDTYKRRIKRIKRRIHEM